jgi:hypothetical protein
MQPKQTDKPELTAATRRFTSAVNARLKLADRISPYESYYGKD